LSIDPANNNNYESRCFTICKKILSIITATICAIAGAAFSIFSLCKIQTILLELRKFSKCPAAGAGLGLSCAIPHLVALTLSAVCGIFIVAGSLYATGKIYNKKRLI
jgi:hypothetical protein